MTHHSEDMKKFKQLLDDLKSKVKEMEEMFDSMVKQCPKSEECPYLKEEQKQ